MRKLLAAVVLLLVLTHVPIAVSAAEEPAWTIVLHPTDFIVGKALKDLRTRHTWAAEFDERTGAFEVALRKTAVAIPAPQCRMDYLILKIPFYYPETPKQASVSERRAVYDALVALQGRGSGSVTARVEAPADVIARMHASRWELVACNLYFALPLSVKVTPQ